jgi:hypothetical protein
VGWLIKLNISKVFCVLQSHHETKYPLYGACT